ncbi:hypothetical protein R1sor_003873 [Riccia sorocarpa]|uniref:Reverse transcriptase zinc-binding domain-containing protein n=1 Tax=Riccia sorocarpa TaxID=122646 RepID=A0ABD3H4P2_9MARC
MWSNRWLSWSGRIVLAQKILPSPPAYVLMTFGLSKKGYKQLEDVWRTFIWGTRDDGRPKKSAIAWDILQRSKLQGGAQVLKLQLHSEAVKVRQISKILEGNTDSWTDIARGFLLRSLASGKQRTEMRKWTAEEALLIGFRMPMKESPTLKNLLQPWYKVRHKLAFDETQGEMEIILREDIDKLIRWVRRVQESNQPLHKCSGWKWLGSNGTSTRRGWLHETKWWKSLLSTEGSSTEKLNRKWDAFLSEQEWNKTWSLTWKRPSTVREGFWWWRTLWQGFWIGAKAQKANVSNGECTRCNRQLETTEHIFWSCPGTRRRWEQILRLLGIPAAARNTWISVKQQAILQKNNNAALWAVMAEFYRTIWRERCDLVFRGQRALRPVSVVLRETRRSVTAWSSSTLSERLRTIVENTLDVLKRCEVAVNGGEELGDLHLSRQSKRKTHTSW